MTQKTIVITGASDGIGLEAASQLAGRGHHLVLVGRSPEKTARALERVRRDDPAATSYLVDMGNLAQVRDLATALSADLGSIDVLCNNAGTVFAKRQLTVDGYEATFAVNHLGPFLLTELLRDRLAPDARIVNTASGSHYQGTMDFGDLGFEHGYQIMRAYGRSKLANVLYTRELARQLADSQTTANALHPGAVATNIWSGAPAFARPVLALAKRFMVTPDDGGARIAYLADSPEVEGRSGGYYAKDRIKRPSKLALDDDLVQRLYTESRHMVGLDWAPASDIHLGGSQIRDRHLDQPSGCSARLLATPDGMESATQADRGHLDLNERARIDVASGSPVAHHGNAPTGSGGCQQRRG